MYKLYSSITICTAILNTHVAADEKWGWIIAARLYLYIYHVAKSLSVQKLTAE